MKRRLRIAAYSIAAGFLALALAVGGHGADWRNASHEPVGIAPIRRAAPEPLVQVYAAGYLAGAGRWRAYVDSRRPRPAYTVYESSLAAAPWRPGSQTTTARPTPAGTGPSLFIAERGAVELSPRA